MDNLETTTPKAQRSTPKALTPYLSSLSRLKGVGDKVYAQLATLLKREIPVLRDLLFLRPFDAVDRSLRDAVVLEDEGEIVTLRVTIDGHFSNAGSRRAPYRISCSNPQLSLMLIFFNGRGEYLKNQYPIGQKRVVSGKIEQGKQGWQIAHPQLISEAELPRNGKKLEPVYPLTQGLYPRKLLSLMQMALQEATVMPEWQDEAWRKQQEWPSFTAALRGLHQPQSREDISLIGANLQRLIYDELLANQLAITIMREKMRRIEKPLPPRAGVQEAERSDSRLGGGAEARGLPPHQICKADLTPPQGGSDLVNKLLYSLPFTLTAGQERVLAEIEADMKSGHRMLRLLQGDVGSGKTIIALLAMLRVVERGGQAALMVPTEILGRQHLASFTKLLEPLGVPVVMLSGKAEPAQRRQIVAGLAEGSLPLVIGTHSVFQDSVNFHNLQFAIIDEQHRFGVNQRLKLSQKGAATHVLLMSATPIPRSLVMTMFGDMDASLLREKPAGRQEITTRALPLSRYEKVMGSVQQALERGEKIYWICPLVEESENLEVDLAAATERHREFQQRFGRLTEITLVHGRITGEAREVEMQKFASGQSRLLVATTVVEVGVDVPDATIMIIEHAERFGLAQLHQLRGRVGRGNKPSSCLLLYADKLSDVGTERLKAMRESNDGFYLAEEDLRLRGGGEVLGTRQSGLPSFHFAELPRDEALLKTARDEVKLILHRDPTLTSERGEALRCLLYLFGQDEKLRYLKG